MLPTVILEKVGIEAEAEGGDPETKWLSEYPQKCEALNQERDAMKRMVAAAEAFAAEVPAPPDGREAPLHIRTAQEFAETLMQKMKALPLPQAPENLNNQHSVQ